MSRDDAPESAPAGPGPTRVLVVDDHAVVRAGLCRVLDDTPDLRVVAEAADGQEAIDLLADLDVDVVVMDLSMPRVDGVEATRAIVRRDPTACVLALTSFSDRDKVVAMLDAGARGYLVKDGDPEEIVRAVRVAAAGGAPLAAAAASALISGADRRADLARLTSREREVLELLAGGLSNRAIAERIAVTEATVKAHLTRVYAALGVGDRVNAVLLARQLGVGPSTTE